MNKTVVELFAGVGGFRIGLNNIKKLDKNGVAIEKGEFEIVWANQWEPSTKSQDAYNCYKTRFNLNSDEISNEDISLVNKRAIPNHTLLCAGFPCQDYSVAHSLSREKGIEGKKGVLWWEIHKVLKEKKPPFILLENVDRLLKSPSTQRGRDFGIMLRTLDELGYGVEWRVINAAEYGHSQRRRRVFIFAFNKNTKYYKKVKNNNIVDLFNDSGVFSRKFPIEPIVKNELEVNLKEKYKDLVDFSNNFNFEFRNSGLMINSIVYTTKTISIKTNPSTIRDILERNVSSDFFLSQEKIDKFNFLRSKKQILRKKPNGEPYYYSEGSMSVHDSIDLPSRTMLTSESNINRSTHIIMDPEKNKLRTLTPLEAERLNEFPDNWTEGMTKRKRFFMMGNALVTGLVSKIGEEISHIIDEENNA